MAPMQVHASKVNPFRYDFTQVPGNATQIIGYRPEEILRDASLCQTAEPTPAAWWLLRSVCESKMLAEILDITMPREDATSDTTVFSVKLVSVVRKAPRWSSSTEPSAFETGHQRPTESNHPITRPTISRNNGPTFVFGGSIERRRSSGCKKTSLHIKRR